MKKNLRELFDKATPAELDAFADDLDSSDLPPDVLASVKNKVYAKTNIKRKPARSVWLRLGAIAACFAVIVGAVLALPILRKSSGITHTTDGNSESEGTGNIRPLHWNDVSSFFGISGVTQTPSEMYMRAFCEITSGVYSNYKKGMSIDDSYVEKKIASVKIRTGWFQSWDGKEVDVYEVNAELYEICGVDSKVAVAVKYLEKPIGDSIDRFFVYANVYAEADSIQDFLKMYNADVHMKATERAFIRCYDGDGFVQSQYRINADALDEIKSMIMKLSSTASYSKYTDTDIKEIEGIVKKCEKRLQINVEIRSAGKIGTLYVLDNGYAYFLGFGDLFALYRIGDSSADALIDAVTARSEYISSTTSDPTSEETIISPA